MFNKNKIKYGISINDGYGIKFTDLILSGKKTIETRNKRTLDPFVGEWVGLIRTGIGKARLVGYIKFGKPISYNSSNFNNDYEKHYISSDDKKFYNNGNKFGYPIIGIKPIKPIKLDIYKPIKEYQRQNGEIFKVARYVARDISFVKENNRKINHKKQTTKLTESYINAIIEESIKRMLKERDSL